MIEGDEVIYRREVVNVLDVKKRVLEILKTPRTFPELQDEIGPLPDFQLGRIVCGMVERKELFYKEPQSAVYYPLYCTTRRELDRSRCPAKNPNSKTKGEPEE